MEITVCDYVTKDSFPLTAQEWAELRPSRGFRI